MIFAELATRYPRRRQTCTRATRSARARDSWSGGWRIAIYTAAIAAIGVVCGEYLGRLIGAPELGERAGVALIGLFTLINLTGVSSGRWVQNVSTAAKVAALGIVIVAALAKGDGAGWHTSLPTAPQGPALVAAIAVAFQAVIWTYYGYLDAGKIAEEVVQPDKSLPRIFLGGIAAVTVLYLLINVAYVHVLPFDRIATSNLVAADVMALLFGSGAATVFAGVALLVVLASLNGNIFVTPRVIFGLARRTRPAPAGARESRRAVGRDDLRGRRGDGARGQGSFNALLALSITLILVVDSIAVLSLLVLRRRTPDAPFRVPLYPVLPLGFVAVYATLFVGTVIAQPRVVLISLGVLGLALGLSWTTRTNGKTEA
jgi:amino acid transporter